MSERAPYLGQLNDIAKKVDDVEQRHNQVVDVYADITSKRKEVDEEIRAHLSVLTQEFSVLKKALDQRRLRSKQATLILSLLAQQDEVAPVKNRINKQPYEQYVTKEWFLNELHEQP